MKTIYKYPLEYGATDIYLPVDAQILSVQLQGRTPQLWAYVDTDQPTVRRQIMCIGTGWSLGGNGADISKLKFIDTIQTGSLVFHFFEYTGVKESTEKAVAFIEHTKE